MRHSEPAGLRPGRPVLTELSFPRSRRRKRRADRLAPQDNKAISGSANDRGRQPRRHLDKSIKAHARLLIAWGIRPRSMQVRVARRFGGA